MSYVDGNSGSGRKALTGGAVALIQVGLALAVVSGFAVTGFGPDKDQPLPTAFYPTDPLPPDPVDTPKPEIDKPLARDTQTTPVPRPLDLATSKPLDITPLDPGLSSRGTDTGERIFIPPVMPSDPPMRFDPRSARPRGDVARWVTTDDYPTADIRAGHTGTVRFRLAIDSSGRVNDCAIVESSGFPGLDAATCRNVTKRARFDAAADGTGAQVAGSYNGTIRWVIPRD